MNFVSDKVTVIEKTTRDYQRNDGTVKTYYNLRVGGFGWGLTLDVKKDLFEKVKEGEEYNFVGKVEGIGNNQYWYVSDIYKK